MIRKYIIPLLFLTGFILFFYPIISNWLSAKEHYTVIGQHNEALEKMSDDEKEKELKKAKEYNESIHESAIPIEDPFAEGANTESKNTVTGYFNVLDIGETMGTLEIPSLHVKLPIYHGVSEDVLQQGVGHMSNSSFPVGGLGTHTALTGHRGLPSSRLFRDLDKVKKDEIFLVRTLDETLAYKVDDIQVVLPSETNWLEMKEDKDYVTLITCEPYMINSHRLLVRGERVPYEEEMAQIDADDSVKQREFFQIALFIGGILTILALITFYFIRKRRMEE